MKKNKNRILISVVGIFILGLVITATILSATRTSPKDPLIEEVTQVIDKLDIKLEKDDSTTYEISEVSKLLGTSIDLVKTSELQLTKIDSGTNTYVDFYTSQNQGVDVYTSEYLDGFSLIVQKDSGRIIQIAFGSDYHRHLNLNLSLLTPLNQEKIEKPTTQEGTEVRRETIYPTLGLDIFAVKKGQEIVITSINFIHPSASKSDFEKNYDANKFAFEMFRNYSFR